MLFVSAGASQEVPTESLLSAWSYEATDPSRGSSPIHIIKEVVIMASRKQILSKAKALGVNLTNPTKVSAFLACVGVSSNFTSLTNAIKKCAKRLGMLS